MVWRNFLMGGVTRDVASDYDARGNRTRITHQEGASFENAYDEASDSGSLRPVPVMSFATPRRIPSAATDPIVRSR